VLLDAQARDVKGSLVLTLAKALTNHSVREIAEAFE